MIRFLSRSEVEAIHENQIALYGGLAGLRDPGLLESALAMPEASHEGEYLHKDIYEMGLPTCSISSKTIPLSTATKGRERLPLWCFSN